MCYEVKRQPRCDADVATGVSSIAPYSGSKLVVYYFVDAHAKVSERCVAKVTGYLNISARFGVETKQETITELSRGFSFPRP